VSATASEHSLWLRDCWYVIAWDHEIPAADAKELFTRTVLGEPILVWRTAAGGFVAMEDRCVHRAAPLSRGRREGDAVRCGYHGLKFDAEGACIEAPGLANLPSVLHKACVRTYPVVCRRKWLFVWMGEPSRADPALLPDNFSNQHPDWKNRPGYLHYETPYLLICDNLLDFSHLSYVHEKTLGGSPAIAQAVPTIEKVPGPNPAWPQIGITVSRRVPDVPAPPFYERFRHFDTRIDRWFVYQFLLPGTLLMHSGGRPVGDAPDDLSRAVQLHSCQTLTPETETSTHYFFQQSHRVGAGDDGIVDSIYASLVQAFEEDRAMITAQHRNLLLRPEAPTLPLAMDAALMQFRRLLAERVQAERSGISA
jgi:phenylpropionate dioxygenase-like ring-hydroxylating dioxygenase large terminal subunit